MIVASVPHVKPMTASFQYKTNGLYGTELASGIAPPPPHPALNQLRHKS